MQPPPGSCAGALSRRVLLRGFATAAGSLLAAPFRAIAKSREARALHLSHTHTGESLSLVYRVGDEYQPQALSRLNHHLRDHRTGDVSEIDPALLDLLHDLRRETGARRPYQVISGYRSAATNRQLRSAGGGVAHRSYHMRGMAIDVRLADVASRSLREAALDLGRGGVGYYEQSDFVHLDVGPVRFW